MAAKITHINYENVSDLFIEFFGRNKSCQKWYFEQLISHPDDKLPVFNRSLSGSLQSWPD